LLDDEEKLIEVVEEALLIPYRRVSTPDVGEPPLAARVYSGMCC
jgi:hypothetical protein